VLEKLDEIDWNSFSPHAGDLIPASIRALASPNVDERRDAFSSGCHICDFEGVVYESTPIAVPFLLELLEDRTTPEKDRILILLQVIADSVPDVVRLRDKVTKSLPTDSLLARPIHWYVLASYLAVEQGYALYCRLLNDKEAALRIGAAFVLGRLINRRPDVSATLMQATETERDNRVRAAFLLALMDLVEGLPEDDPVRQSATLRFEDAFNEAISSAATVAEVSHSFGRISKTQCSAFWSERGTF